MSQIRRLRTEQGFIYQPAAINAAMDATAKDVAHAVAGDTIGMSGAEPWAVVSGLEVVSEGDNDIAMTAGVAVSRASDVPRIVSLWSGMESYVGSLPAPDLTHPRIDLICLVVSDGPLASSAQGRVGDVPAPVATQNGATAVLTIVAGTPEAAPVAPALPADAILLAYCLTETSGTVTILDKRTFAVGPRKRSGDEPIEFVRDASAVGEVALFKVIGRPDTLDATGPTPDAYESAIKWNRSIDLPVVARGRGLSEESAGDHGLMLIPGGREYWIAAPVIGAPGRTNTNPSPERLGVIEGSDYLSIYETTDTGVDVMSIGIPLPLDLRGLEIIGANVTYEVTGTFARTSVSFSLQQKDWGSSTWTDVFFRTVPTLAGPVAVNALDLTSGAANMLGGYLRLLIYAEKVAGAGLSPSRLRVHGVGVKVREGREY